MYVSIHKEVFIYPYKYVHTCAHMYLCVSVLWLSVRHKQRDVLTAKVLQRQGKKSWEVGKVWK